MAASFAGVASVPSGLVQPQVPGAVYTVIIEMTGDSSYPTGGYPFGVTQLQAAIGQGMKIDAVDMENMALVNDAVGTPATTAYGAAYDRLNGKIQLFDTGTASAAPFAEVASTTNVATTVARMRVWFR